MYYHTSEKELIDCAIIKVDSSNNVKTYCPDGSVFNYGYNYMVRIKDIDESMKFINALFNELNIPCSRIYISGFACLTEDYIWTKERIANHAINEAKKNSDTIDTKVYIK